LLHLDGTSISENSTSVLNANYNKLTTVYSVLMTAAATTGTQHRKDNYSMYSNN